MARKSGNKWKTAKCGRCGEAHEGYSGKLDKDGVEYVVCGITHKRMNVANTTLRDAAFSTAWVNMLTLIRREKEMVNEMHCAGMRIRDRLDDLRD